MPKVTSGSTISTVTAMISPRRSHLQLIGAWAPVSGGAVGHRWAGRRVAASVAAFGRARP